MSVPAYPEYKDSGVPWLGTVPRHWEVLPVKAVATYNDEVLGDATDPELEIDYIEISDVDETAGVKASAALTFGASPSRARRVVRSGDILVSTVRTYLRAIAPVPSALDGAVASTGFSVIRGRSADSAYLGYAMRSEAFVAEVIARSVGVSYPAINASDLVAIPVALPSKIEQAAIAAFLDRETAKIGALVAEQWRLIALLKEKRQAVISHAVTKGLSPHALMKDSGIEWLGEIPAHWEVRRLKQVAVGQLSYGANEAADEAVEDHPRFVRITDVAADGTLRPDTFRSLPPAVAEPYLLEEGDILLARSGGTVGKSFIYRKSWGDCCYAGYLIRLRVAVSTYLPDLVYMTLQSNAYWQQLGANQIQSTIQNFSAEKYGDMTFAFPPLEEQNAIASELSQRLSRFDELSHEAEQAIALLKERRAALISAAVTGKIDVRGLVNQHEMEAA